MKEVEYHELEYWGFECPECAAWNETQDDPEYQESVSCDQCGVEFLPVKG